MMRWSESVCVVLLAGLLLFACDERTATEVECRAIFDRIVDIELRELGFRDPELSERKRVELRRVHAGQLQSCVGLPLPAHAMSCVAHAETTEQLSHECMRPRGR
jgi:hypothetical protein